VTLQEPVAGEPSGTATPVSGSGSRALRNTLLVLVARIASRLVALFTVIAMGNHLGDGGFGRMQTVVTLSALVSTVADLGFYTLYVREGARRTDQLERYLNNVMSLKVFLLAAAFAVLFGTLRITGLSDLLLPAFAVMFLAGYSTLLRGTLYALQRLGFEAIDIVLESLVLLGVTLAGVATHQGVAFFLWAYAASYGFSCVYFGVVLRVLGIARLRWRFELDVIRPWFFAGLPLAVTYMVTTVYFKVDVPILQHYRPYSEVGWYTLAYKPFEALLFVPLTMRTVVFPLMSVYYRSAPDRLALSSEKFFKGLVLIGLPCGVGLFVLAAPINSLLHLYPESEAALRILAIGIPFMFVDNTFIAALNAMDRQVLYAWVALTALVVNVGLNLVLIPRYGYLGASWSTSACEALLATMGWVLLARLARPVPVWRASWRILAAGVGMGLALVPFRNAHSWATVAAIAVGAAVYAVLLIAFRAFDAEERALGRRALSGAGSPAR
jgi:O-antigen/teichoic acid export membrane protein